MSISFHSLKIAEVIDETSDAKSIRFELPEELRRQLTLKASSPVST